MQVLHDKFYGHIFTRQVLTEKTVFTEESDFLNRIDLIEEKDKLIQELSNLLNQYYKQ